MQGRVKGSLLHPQHVAGNLLHVERDAIAVHASAGSQRLEHKQVEGALQAVVGAVAHALSPIDSYRKFASE